MVAEGRPRQQLHGEEDDFFLFGRLLSLGGEAVAAQIMDPANVGMGDTLGESHFVLETLEGSLVQGQFFAKRLEGDAFIQLRWSASSSPSISLVRFFVFWPRMRRDLAYIMWW